MSDLDCNVIRIVMLDQDCNASSGLCQIRIVMSLISSKSRIFTKNDSISQSRESRYIESRLYLKNEHLERIFRVNI